MLTHRALLAVHATGSGKTLTAVATINCMLAKYPNIRVVVITPLSLLENFRKAIKQFGLNINNPKFLSQVDIRSYDDFINQEKRRKTIDCKNTFFIIDEAHNFRSDVTIKDSQFKKGSKSFVVMKCAAQAFKVLLLTATPIVNSPADLRNLYCMIEGIDPVNRPPLKLFKETYNEFLTKPCLMSYYEVSKEDFPERIEIPIEETTLVMDDEYYEEYKKVELKEASDNLLNYFGIPLFSNVPLTLLYSHHSGTNVTLISFASSEL
jgi:superfamily II DNA or RNA helicase